MTRPTNYRAEILDVTGNYYSELYHSRLTRPTSDTDKWTYRNALLLNVGPEDIVVDDYLLDSDWIRIA